MKENNVFFIARWQMQPGQEDVISQALAQLVAHSRAEPGCLYYQPHVSVSQPDLLYIYEAYASPAAATAHREAAYFRELVLETIVPLLRSREVMEVTPLAEVINSRF